MGINRLLRLEKIVEEMKLSQPVGSFTANLWRMENGSYHVGVMTTQMQQVEDSANSLKSAFKILDGFLTKYPPINGFTANIEPTLWYEDFGWELAESDQAYEFSKTHRTGIERIDEIMLKQAHR